MLSRHRLAATATTVVAVAFAPGAALARPDTKLGAAERTTSQDKVSPDARYGVPEGNTLTLAPDTRVAEVPSTAFEWADAAVGGGAALGLVLVIAGGAVAVRPRHHAGIR